MTDPGIVGQLCPPLSRFRQMSGCRKASGPASLTGHGQARPDPGADSKDGLVPA